MSEELLIEKICFANIRCIDDLVLELQEAFEALTNELNETLEAKNADVRIELRYIPHTEEPHRMVRYDNINLTLTSN